jgi:D-3-phosphoglycerate dehydrogenase
MQVVRLSLWIDPSFDTLLLDRPGLGLDILDIKAPDADGWAKLAKAQIYHISAAKDEVPTTWLVTPELLQRCPRLLCVSTSGAGYDTVDVQACTDAGVLVVNQAGGNANSVAEHAIGLMIAVSRRFGESSHMLKHGQGFSREDLMGHELNGKTLGLVGLGHIGTRTAQLGRAFGMRVLAYDPYLDEATLQGRGAQGVTLDELLQSSDIVSLHCPRTQETRNMFDKRAYEKMKPGAIFISTARGGIHNEKDLYDALCSGHLAGAGLDVWDVEPPPPDHPLLGLPNVVPTYHTAGVSHEGRKNVATIAAEQILAISAGKPAPRVVNPQVTPHFTERFNRAKEA